MKYITFTVPCYNSSEYMRKCIDSLLPGGDDVEIIIVNDGSKDSTLEIANEYKEKYPNIVRVIDKENGGHGSGVNAGLEKAEGLYFKVVDSDDWVKETSLKRLLRQIKSHVAEGTFLDMYLVNYVYEHVCDNTQYPVHYSNVFPKNKIFSWKDIKIFRASQFLTMHAIVYRTEFIRDCNLKLPEHTFYVDNIFIMHPLPYVKSMYYINTDFYRYFIGREDQSMNEAVFYKRIDQQIRVFEHIAADFVRDRNKITSRKLERYMIRHIAINATIVSVFLVMKNSEDDKEKLKAVWKRIHALSPKLYRELRCTTVAGIVSLPGKAGRFIAVNGYRITQKIYKYN